VDRYPVFLDGAPAGELSVTPDRLYVCCEVICRLPQAGVYRAVAVGGAGEVLLGVPEPERERFVLRRRLSAKCLAAAGPLERCELRRGAGAGAAPDASRWRREDRPEELFRGAFLRERLRDAGECLAYTEGGARLLAIPYDRRRPFPLPALFCFARIRRIGGRCYAVYAFDAEEKPVFR
jgi:hypothetical protein